MLSYAQVRGWRRCVSMEVDGPALLMFCSIQHRLTGSVKVLIDTVDCKLLISFNQCCRYQLKLELRPLIGVILVRWYTWCVWSLPSMYISKLSGCAAHWYPWRSISLLGHLWLLGHLKDIMILFKDPIKLLGGSDPLWHSCAHAVLLLCGPFIFSQCLS